MKTEAEIEPAASAERLVDRLADKAQREQALSELYRLGPAAVPAVREGLRDGRWQVRRWCAVFLDHAGGPESRPWLVPLLRDVKAEVRLWAVHVIACERCAGGESPVDVVPLLLERLWHDESIRVRRQASCALGVQAQTHASSELVALYRDILVREADSKIRKHAAWGLHLCRKAGIEV